MKNTILILISLLFITGVSEGKEVSSLQDRGGVKYETNSEVGFTGRLVEKYEDGQKELEINYKDGKKEGLSTDWYDNGQKNRERNYKDGREDGLWTWWDKDGNVTKTKTYKNGELVK